MRGDVDRVRRRPIVVTARRYRRDGTRACRFRSRPMRSNLALTSRRSRFDLAQISSAVDACRADRVAAAHFRCRGDARVELRLRPQCHASEGGCDVPRSSKHLARIWHTSEASLRSSPILVDDDASCDCHGAAHASDSADFLGGFGMYSPTCNEISPRLGRREGPFPSAIARLYSAALRTMNRRSAVFSVIIRTRLPSSGWSYMIRSKSSRVQCATCPHGACPVNSPLSAVDSSGMYVECRSGAPRGS